MSDLINFDLDATIFVRGEDGQMTVPVAAFRGKIMQSAAFSPLSLANLTAWYSASRETSLNDGDACLPKDKSGNAHDMAQGTSSLRPLWKTTYYNFDGTDDTVAASLGAVNAPFTLFASVYFDNLSQPSGDFDYVMDLGDAASDHGNASMTRWGLADADVDKFYTFNGGDVFKGSALAGQTVVRLIFRCNTGAPYYSLFKNGVADTIEDDSQAINTSGLLTLGVSPTSANYFKGRIKDVGVYSAYLSDGDCALLDTYMAALP